MNKESKKRLEKIANMDICKYITSLEQDDIKNLLAELDSKDKQIELILKDINDRIDMLHMKLKGQIKDKYFEGKLIGEVRGLEFVKQSINTIL